MCNSFLTGIVNQGYSCKSCSQNICKNCRSSTISKVWYGCGAGSEKKEDAAATSNSKMSKEMNETVMNFYLNYTSRDKDGKLIVKNLPKEWVELFKAANVRPNELKNPDTVLFLLDLMNKQLEQIAQEELSASVGGDATEVEAATSVISKAKVLYDYASANDDDLPLTEGSL